METSEDDPQHAPRPKLEGRQVLEVAPKLLGVATVLGLVLYLFGEGYLGAYYDAAGLSPADVGLDRGIIIERISFAIVGIGVAFLFIGTLLPVPRWSSLSRRVRVLAVGLLLIACSSSLEGLYMFGYSQGTLFSRQAEEVSPVLSSTCPVVWFRLHGLVPAQVVNWEIGFTTALLRG